MFNCKVQLRDHGQLHRCSSCRADRVMQARADEMSSSDLLSTPFLEKQQHIAALCCISAGDHVPLFTAAAASLRSSLAGSRHDAADVQLFLSESCSRIAAAYEQLSACTFAAHSLRHRSPCVRPDDVMHSCLATIAARSSSETGHDISPYPRVLGSDFEVSLSKETYGYSDALPSAAALDPDPHNGAAGQEGVCQAEPALHSPRKRRWMDVADAAAEAAADTRALRCDAPPASSITPALYSKLHASAPLTDTALAGQAFDWLPGDGVV